MLTANLRHAGFRAWDSLVTSHLHSCRGTGLRPISRTNANLQNVRHKAKTKNKNMRQLLLISTAVLVLTVSHAQTITCPTNLDFELGNFYNWTVVPSSDTTIVNGAGIDTCGIFSLVCPNSGQYSARIGDLIGTGLNFSSSITYSMLTDSSSANPTIYYAIVFEDGNHPPSSQAYWECSAKDSSGNVITTLKYTVGNMPPPFQLSSTCTGSPTYFLPWTPLAFNLDGYINQIITINFTVSDCSAGGLHQCYSYIDACDLLLNAVEI
ncbi:MAG: hypothetical protein Q7K43_01215, partial [Candidatus Woesearchaeota archaeon]|nr:hypothetical protein [Candidatus Woesearchaeota archaeon]